MSKHAFKPESLGPLEDRHLLSGAASAVRRPIGLSGVAFNTSRVKISGYFQQYALGGNFPLLRTQLANQSTGIPYHVADGLGPKTNQILDQMRANQAADVPGAIKTAYQQVITGLTADVDARIANGTVFVFDKDG